MSNVDKAISLALKQHGVFATFQLGEIGIPEGSINRVIKNGIFRQMHRGVYLLEGTKQSWHQSALMNVLKNGPLALLSHESALINAGLLNADFISYRKLQQVPFHVTLPRVSSRRKCSSVHRTIYKDHLLIKSIVNAIPQVAVEYSIIESARHLPEQIFGSVFESAIHTGFTNENKLRKALDQLRPAPGRSKLRVEKIIHDYLGISKELRRAESVLETRVMRVVSRCTNSKICPQYEVFLNKRNYRIDIALPEYKLAIEADGYAFHGGREAFDSDKKRQNDLVSAGWTILRFTATQSDDQIQSHLTSVLARWASKRSHSDGFKAHR